jgi:hypothetical protein
VELAASAIGYTFVSLEWRRCLRYTRLSQISLAAAVNTGEGRDFFPSFPSAFSIHSVSRAKAGGRSRHSWEGPGQTPPAPLIFPRRLYIALLMHPDAPEGAATGALYAIPDDVNRGLGMPMPVAVYFSSSTEVIMSDSR